jgi:hypothetical protein
MLDAKSTIWNKAHTCLNHKDVPRVRSTLHRYYYTEMPRRIIPVRNGDIPAKKEYRKIWKRGRIVQLKNVKGISAHN